MSVPIVAVAQHSGRVPTAVFLSVGKYASMAVSVLPQILVFALRSTRGTIVPSLFAVRDISNQIRLLRILNFILQRLSPGRLINIVTYKHGAMRRKSSSVIRWK